MQPNIWAIFWLKASRLVQVFFLGEGEGVMISFVFAGGGGVFF